MLAIQAFGTTARTVLDRHAGILMVKVGSVVSRTR